ncbi:MAG: Flp pilus assembly complex ATPase component TadA [Candidatus Omnitrophica bacterium]|nr:Flp pilus assembly complex ATPase component TadA [Candidatus Omnitrophota bacterium]
MSKTIVIFSTKGGVGSTLIATNLAVCLSQQRRRVALIDLDLQFGGDVAKMLNITISKTIADVISVIEELNSSILGKCRVHHSSGVDILSAVSQPKQGKLIKPQFLKKFLSLLAEKYDYVIIDAEKKFSEKLTAIFEQANLILLVTTPDILSIKQTNKAIQAIEALYLPLEMLKVVVNRAESIGAVRFSEIRKVLPAEIIANIPSSGRAVGLSVNRGIPVVVDESSDPVSEAIRDLANILTMEDMGRSLEKILPKQPSLADSEEIRELKEKIHNRLIEKLDLEKLDLFSKSSLVGEAGDSAKAKRLRDKTERLITHLLAEERTGYPRELCQRLVKEIADESLGLGPLEDLLKDPEITEIMVNNKDQIYIEREGKLELTNKKFINNEQILHIIERIVAPLGRRIDESIPMVDARLADGSRVNAIISPLSLKGPMLTIRKFSHKRLSAEDFIALGSFTKEMGDFFRACVVGRKNIIISGGTGSGKTTLLNVFSSFIPEGERIITIEDSAELRLSQQHWGALEARMPNIEGKGAITLRDLLRNSLRMRPDRIIIGECRGGETLDMLQAMNTGHDGSLTTVHANSTRDVLSRLETLVLMSGMDLPVRAIRQQIAAAVDLIIQTSRMPDGSRKVICVSELTGIKENGNIVLEDIFIFRQKGIDKNRKVIGSFEPTGFLPTFIEELEIKGIEVDRKIFERENSYEK